MLAEPGAANARVSPAGAQVVRADPAGAAQWEQHISPPVLATWVAHVNDPLLSEDAVDLLAALAAVPACLPSLQVR